MLTPTQYASVDAFLHRAQAHFMENEAVNSVMLGIGLRLRNYPDRFQFPPFLFTVENDSRRIELAAMMTPPHNLIVHCGEGYDPAAMNLLADHLILHQVSLPGVFGALPFSEQFAGIWSERTGRKARIEMRERAFELRKVIPPRPAPGKLRLAEASDLPLLTAWTRAFQLDALHEEMPFEEAREMTANRIGDRLLFVWDPGEPVSMAAAARPTQHGITVNLVYTPPDLRGCGYASNCVATLSQHLLAEGYQFCTLFTDLANPTSNDIYQKIGYRPIADFNEYRFENN